MKIETGRIAARARLAMSAMAVFLLFGASVSAQSTGPTVKIAQGELRGTTAPGADIFKGIPYGKPPVGDLRWRAPQPATGWSGVRDATAPGAACMQGGELLAYVKTLSEDCLFLNVWRPAGIKAGAKLPVMVWIHGGGYTRGVGTAPQYAGVHMAEHGVIEVTLNYRLGRMGFFAHPALTAEDPKGLLGNYALMDQILALKWVKANIAAFGGNPDNVTVFGESAGAMAINALMVSPPARGLFAKAIVESGFGRTAYPPIRGEEARTGEKLGSALAEKLGVTGTGPEALKALRALPAQQIIAANLGDNGGELSSAPVIDGIVLPEPIMTAFAAGHEAKVPYLAGGNSFEASLRPEATKDPEAVLVRTGARDKIVAVYGGDVKAAAQNYVTESSVIEPDRFLARLHTRNGQKAWVYYFSFVPPSWRATNPGLPHAGEIPYVFNTLRDYETTIEYGRAPVATAEDLPIADAAITYWTNFAKNSDPASANGVQWPKFDLSTETVLEFGTGGPKAMPQFHKTSLDLVTQLTK